MSDCLSVVVPCYNEQEVIEETYKQLNQALSAICARFELSFEIIFVNDGSKDKTLSILQHFADTHASTYPNSQGCVRVVALSRNFGHQIALSAGLTVAKGNAIVAIDADLQDPPTVIEDMVACWKRGVDVAYGVRSSREGETVFKLLTAKWFYIIVRKITGVDIPLDTGDFRLMSRRALNIFNAMHEKHRFIRGMIPWIGLQQEAVMYKRAARFAGTTKYPLGKMLKLAFDGITAFSSAPLRAAYIMGAFFSILCAVYILFIAIAAIFCPGTMSTGYGSIMVAVLFLGAVQLITIGILGEYIGRIYDEVRKRPLFIIDDKASRLEP